MLELAEIALPEQFAVAIIANHAGRPVRGDDALAIGDRRGGTIGVGGMRRFLARKWDRLLPNLSARLAVETNHRALTAFLVQRLRDKYAIAPDNGGGTP